MDNKDLWRSAGADGLSSLRDPAPSGLAHSASIPSAEKLLAALELVMQYRRGEGRFRFSGMPDCQREIAMFDAWQEVEQVVVSAITAAKQEPVILASGMQLRENSRSEVEAEGLQPVPEATPKPHAQSTRIAELEEALTLAANRMDRMALDAPMQSRTWYEYHEWAQAARASVLSKGEDPPTPHDGGQ